MRAPDVYLLVAEQALADELGILDTLAHTDMHPVLRARRIRAIAADLRGEATILDALADRICQTLTTDGAA